jgi:hypothetical protein
MKTKTTHMISLALSLIGLILLIIKAINYIAKSNKMSNWYAGIGLILILIGAFLNKQTDFNN